MAEPENINEFWKAQFESVGRNPLSWFFQAQQLKTAAEILYSDVLLYLKRMTSGNPRTPDTSVVNIFMLTASFALENLLKAVCIAKDPNIVSSDSISWGKDGHKLSKLAAKAGIVLSKEEDEFLARCTEFIFWNGRYPIPLHSERYKPEGVSVGQDYRTFNDLYAKITVELQKNSKVVFLQTEISDEPD